MKLLGIAFLLSVPVIGVMVLSLIVTRKLHPLYSAIIAILLGGLQIWALHAS